MVALCLLSSGCHFICHRSLHLAHGAVGWSIVCVFVAFPGHTHFLFLVSLPTLSN